MNHHNSLHQPPHPSPTGAQGLECATCAGGGVHAASGGSLHGAAPLPGRPGTRNESEMISVYFLTATSQHPSMDPGCFFYQIQRILRIVGTSRSWTNTGLNRSEAALGGLHANAMGKRDSALHSPPPSPDTARMCRPHPQSTSESPRASRP